MTLKSIEKHLANHSFFSNPWLADMIADIEAEIAERYMLLPVDADGVVIHTGDEMETRCAKVTDRFTACFFAENGDALDDETCFFDPANSRHVKPRTVEDVLCDMIHEYACTDMTTEQTAAKYADELRDLLGGDGR